jgi:hypothetical protein
MEDQAENLSVPVIGFHSVQIDSEGGGIQKMRSGEGRHDFTRNSLRNDFSKKGESRLSWGHSGRTPTINWGGLKLRLFCGLLHELID